MNNEQNNKAMNNETTKDTVINSIWDKIDAQYETACISRDVDFIAILEGVKEDLFNTLNN